MSHEVNHEQVSQPTYLTKEKASRGAGLTGVLRLNHEDG